MNAIVVADRNYGIYKKGKPLATIPAEQKSRMQEITGKVIVYGAEWINELPGQQPVMGCMNIIFTDGAKTHVKTGKDVFVYDSLSEVRKALSKFPDKDIYIISNEKLYKEFFKDTDVIHLTKIDFSYDADAFYENLDKNADFEITADSDEQYCFDIVYSFLKYERRNKK